MKFLYNLKLYNFKYLLNKFLLIIFSLIIIRLTLSSTIDYNSYVKFGVSFYDTGSLMSLLICLEHIFICYYLIIILVMVYWSLYVFVIDFSSWNITYKNNKIRNVFLKIIEKDKIFYNNLFFLIYLYLLKIFIWFKEIECISFLYNTHINFTLDKYIPLHFFGLFPYHFKKAYLNQKNIINILSNFLKDLDFLGRPFLLINYGSMKFIILLSLLIESTNLLKKNYNYLNNLVNDKMNNYLFNRIAKSFFFFLEKDFLYYNKKSNYSKLIYNKSIYSLRMLYNNIFEVNQFKHSGIFEAVWAAFPTIIIISILIPSLILLYSFEDILNPKLSIKVIASQWYWTYEFDNWITYNSKNIENNIIKNLFNFFNINDITDNKIKNIYTNFAFNSVILDLNSLDIGNKRLLEVDNRLVLSTNLTTRFLVSSTDVLHSFAVPELGFKVDATPGRLNQILMFISRPGIYYGQCSELCGTNHGFMPIVIQAVTPINFLNYIDKINNIDLEEINYNDNDDFLLENDKSFNNINLSFFNNILIK